MTKDKRWKLAALAALAAAWSGYRSFVAPPPARTAVTHISAKKVIESPEHAVRSAAIHFVRALANGDVAKAESFATDDPQSRRMIQAMSRNYQSAHELKRALSLRFSERNEADINPILQLLNQAQVAIVGDHAELSQHDKGESLPFEHVKGRWLVDATELARRRKAPSDPSADAARRAAAATQTVAAVREGQYRSADEALADHARRLGVLSDAQASSRD